jgi:hypothetical protein
MITSVFGRGRLFVTAALAILALCSTIVFKTYTYFAPQQATQFVRIEQDTTTFPTKTTSRPRWQEELLLSAGGEATDAIVLRGAEEALSQGIAVTYAALQQSGELGTEKAAEIAENIQTDTDTTYERMLLYRGAMRVALEPLLANRESEFELYARYIDSKDPQYLATLGEAARNYRSAVENALRVVVPTDAAREHISAINSLLQFAVVLEDISQHASDPVASVVLLRTFTHAETEVYTSFNELARYYATKKNV